MNINVMKGYLRAIDTALSCYPYREQMFRLTLNSLAQIGILSNSYDPMRAAHLRNADYLEASTMSNLLTLTIERAIKRLLIHQKGLRETEESRTARQEIDQSVSGIIGMAKKFGIYISREQIEKCGVFPAVNLDGLRFIDNSRSRPRGNPNRPEWAEEQFEQSHGQRGKIFVIPTPIPTPPESLPDAASPEPGRDIESIMARLRAREGQSPIAG